MAEPPAPSSKRTPEPADAPRLWPPSLRGPFGLWPWFHLVYLAFAWLPLAFMPRVAPGQVGWTLLAMLAFLPLYFAGYLVEQRRAPLVVAGIAAIGFALVPVNPGGNTFLIYAIALAANRFGAAATLLVFALCIGALALELAWLDAPWVYLGFTALIAGIVATAAQYERATERRDSALRLSQDEVRRLARSAERERIGRDLHDLLGHTLSLIAMKSELALRLADRDPGAARAQMLEVERVARDALRQVRLAVSGIRAAGVEAELARARLALLEAGVRLDYRLDAVALPVETETTLALAVREAVTNVVRHARANRVEVELERLPRELRLRIVDDGRGADVAPGHGLAGMRERVEALGGSLEVDSAPGEGMTLTLCVPLPPEAAPGAAATAQA